MLQRTLPAGFIAPYLSQRPDPVSYDRLRQTLQRIEAERGTKGNRLFYMATPPSAFRPIACQLGRSRLACEENGSWRRIIIEKLRLPPTEPAIEAVIQVWAVVYFLSLLAIAAFVSLFALLLVRH
jgi:Glucose-6-phosphate dehydrogenase, NAD binding domain